MFIKDLPPEFRSKYDRLRHVIDARTGLPIADILKTPSSPRKINEKTGESSVEFVGGILIQINLTHSTPIIALYGPITQFWIDQEGSDGAFGRPLTDVVALSDGSRCAIFEGGHIHEDNNQRIVPFSAQRCPALNKPNPPPFQSNLCPGGMPVLFHEKWISLFDTQTPEGQNLIAVLGAPSDRLKTNLNTGEHYVFTGGVLVARDHSTIPLVVYGKICDLWNKVGGTNGGLGRPLMDVQPLDGGGLCQVFEGGHIHKRNDKAELATADLCRAQHKPTVGVRAWWNGLVSFWDFPTGDSSLQVHIVRQVPTKMVHL